MPKPKPPLIRLSELAPGQFGDCFALLVERTLAATKTGKSFYPCRFRDDSRVVTGMIWSDSEWYAECERDWHVGQCFKVRGVYQDHPKYGPQIELKAIRLVNDDDKADGFDPNQLVEHSRYNSSAMFDELWALAENSVEDVPLRRLVLTILDKQKLQLKQVPATQRNFYPFAGGLLEHILCVTHSCLHLADKYVGHYPDLEPPINRDLVVAGAILHDIGRTIEFNEDILSVQPTVSGRLLGHLFLGRDLVRDTARELGDVNPELVQLLEHIVISHLNHPEWGSPRLPLIPECLIIHHADDLDAKMEMYVRCLTRDKEPGDFTGRDPVLGRHLYKGRSV